METLRMEDNYSRDRIYEPSFDSPFATDDMSNFDANSGIFDMSFVGFTTNSQKSTDASFVSYPSPDNTSNNNHFPYNPTYATNNTFSELETSPGCQTLEVSAAQTLGTCQLSSISPVSDSFYQSTPISQPTPVATYPDLENHPRRHSECPSSHNSKYGHSSISTTGSEDTSRSSISTNNDASQANTIKPAKKRGRKRANVSEEERRNRKLERGRVAANKCRQKKRVRENDLESKGLQLLIERDQMLRLNHELRDEIMGLQSQIMRHVGGECGGIPNAEQMMAFVNIPPERLDEVDRRKEDQLKYLLGNPAFRSGSVAVDAGMSQSQ